MRQLRNSLAVSAITAISAFAHLEVLYTPKTELESGSEVKISAFFTHPFAGEPIMKRGMNENGKVLGVKEIFVVHNGKKSNASSVKDVLWSTKSSKGPGSEIVLSGSDFKSAGDDGIVLVPHPYWEKEEEAYIQQITKLFVNKGGFDTDWQNRIADGYTEIIPLNNPYKVTVGQVFRAKVVDNEGNPVPDAVVEIELLNYPVNPAKAFYGGKAFTENEKKGTNTVVTDANGVFAFVPQVAGYWGFAALFAGNDKEFNGKDLEQDPIIWIQVEN
jgi:cobalt/nickel transport protein